MAGPYPGNPPGAPSPRGGVAVRVTRALWARDTQAAATLALHPVIHSSGRYHVPLVTQQHSILFIIPADLLRDHLDDNTVLSHLQLWMYFCAIHP